jgi:hypothetical protein
MLEAVLLVIVLCEREAGVRNDLRKHGAAKARSDSFLRLLCQTFLFLVVIEDDGSILAGPGPEGRIVALPEHVQQLPIGYSLRVVIDLDRLGMVSQVMIGRIFLCSSGIPYACADDAWQTPELGIRSPESA